MMKWKNGDGNSKSENNNNKLLRFMVCGVFRYVKSLMLKDNSETRKCFHSHLRNDKIK